MCVNHLGEEASPFEQHPNKSLPIPVLSHVEAQTTPSPKKQNRLLSNPAMNKKQAASPVAWASESLKIQTPGNSLERRSTALVIPNNQRRSKKRSGAKRGWGMPCTHANLDVSHEMLPKTTCKTRWPSEAFYASPAKQKKRSGPVLRGEVVLALVSRLDHHLDLLRGTSGKAMGGKPSAIGAIGRE